MGNTSPKKNGGESKAENTKPKGAGNYKMGNETQTRAERDAKESKGGNTSPWLKRGWGTRAPEP